SLASQVMPIALTFPCPSSPERSPRRWRKPLERAFSILDIAAQTASSPSHSPTGTPTLTAESGSHAVGDTGQAGRGSRASPRLSAVRSGSIPRVSIVRCVISKLLNNVTRHTAFRRWVLVAGNARAGQRGAKGGG